MLENHHLRIVTPALTGPDALRVRRLTGQEALSSPFTYTVELTCRNHSLEISKLLGQELCIALELSAQTERYFHGYIASVEQADNEGDRAVYLVVLRPHLWRLTQAADCRVFQNQSIHDILDEVLGKDHGIDHVEHRYPTGNRSTYAPYEYRVQYCESDFNFVSRLLEQEGIYYFFRHEKDKHVLVLSDSVTPHATVPGFGTVEYRRSSGERGSEGDRIWDWRISSRVLPGTYASGDYDYLSPRTVLQRTSGSSVERRHAKAVTPDYEVYDHPEPVAHHRGHDPKLLEEYTQVRIEEMHAGYEVVRARTNARGLHVGALFGVQHCPRPAHDKHQHLITSAEFQAHQTDPTSGQAEQGIVYESTLTAINSGHPFRPARVHAGPRMSGHQLAVVVGRKGETVSTDELGRIKVQFHWDRRGKSDERSSCWVRVAQSAAGANWGTLFIPHVGHEVVVSFADGNPDRPVVVGSVYNGSHAPPVKLPKNDHKSLIRDHFGNEMVFDGTPGKEHISIHSPSHHSVIKVGKSCNLFTHSKSAIGSFNNET